MRSKTLERIATRDGRIAAYEYEPGNDMGEHWLHLVHPFTVDGAGAIHEITVRDVISQLTNIEPKRMKGTT